MARAKRKKFLVDRNVQGALGMRITQHWAIFILCSVVVTSVLRALSNMEQPGLASLGEAMRQEVVSLGVLLSLLPWFLHDSLRLSNRFAGPMVRLREAVKQLKVGEPNQRPLKFREDDFWQEIAVEFNELKRIVDLERAELEECRLRIAKLERSPSAAPVQVMPFSPAVEGPGSLIG